MSCEHAVTCLWVASVTATDGSEWTQENFQHCCINVRWVPHAVAASPATGVPAWRGVRGTDLPTPAQKRRRKGDWFSRAIVGFAAAFYFAFFASIVVELLTRRSEAIVEATRRAEGLDYVLAEHLRGTVVSIDAALKQLATHSRQVGGPEADGAAWSPVLASVLVSLPGVGSLSVMSADGVIRHSTVGGIVGQSRADRDLTRALREPAGTGLVAGAPFRSERSSRVVIPLGYRLDSEQGVFTGSVVATLDLELLRAIYRAVDVGPNGAIALVHRDGAILLRQPPDSAHLPQNLAGGALMNVMSQGGHNGVIVGSLVEGGEERITVWRVIANPRLLVAVSLATADVTDDFNRDALVRLVALALMGLAVFVAGRGLEREAASRARAKQAIAQRERQLMDAERIADMASLRFAEPDLLATVSERARSFFGWPAGRTTVSANELAGLVTDVDAESLHQEIRDCQLAHRDFALDLRIGDPRNPARLVRVEGSWEPGGPEAPGGVMAVFQDVTQERRSEGRLRHIERLEAIGRLTGGVAHDFNNMLTVILGNIDRLSDDMDDPQARRDVADEIGRAAERAAELTRQLLAFARRQPLRPQRVDINELIRIAAGMLGRLLGRQIELRLELSSPPCHALIDPGQIETALVNLCANARDAMPSGGLLTIASDTVDLDAAYAREHPDAVPGRYVLVSVSDTGVGIPSEQLPFVFEPFYSTKEIGRGTGLGLAMVYGFVKQSGGHVRILSEVGRGTTIRIYLPEDGSALPLMPLAATPETGLPRGTGETILVVEDEDLVRDSVSRQLGDLGYGVIAVADGGATLAALASGQRIDLMLTDVILASGPSGREIAERAALVRPDLPVVFMSGYSESVIAHEGRLEPAMQVLSKPFRKQELGDTIRRTLDARHGPHAPR